MAEYINSAVTSNTSLLPQVTNDSLLRHIGFPLSVVLLQPETGKVEVRTVFNRRQLTSKIELEIRQRNSRGWNVYVEVNSSRKANGRSSAADIISLRAVVGDIDAKDGRCKDDCLDLIRKLPKVPTIIVDTGGGYQTWYFYEVPLETTPDHISRHVALNRAIAHCTDGDAVHDLPRMLRLGGYTNWPDKRKRERGRTPALVQVIGGCNLRYELEELEEAFHSTLESLLPVSESLGPAADLNSDLMNGVSTDWFDKLSPDDKDACLAKILNHPRIQALADTSDGAPQPNWRTVLAACARSGAPKAYELCKAWARTSPRFEETDFNRRWQSYSRG